MLNLYRSIVRLHRKKLPPALRTMGNAYVRHEFDLHKKAHLTQARSPPPPPRRRQQGHRHHRMAFSYMLATGEDIREAVARV